MSKWSEFLDEPEDGSESENEVETPEFDPEGPMPAWQPVSLAKPAQEAQAAVAGWGLGEVFPTGSVPVVKAAAGTAKARRVERRARRGRRSVWSVLGVIAAITLGLGALGGGGWMIYEGSQPNDVIEEHPLPAQADLQVEPSAVPVDPSELSKLWPIQRSDNGGGERAWEKIGVGDKVTQMSVVDMEPGSVMVPSMESYSLIRGSAVFEDSKYGAFQSLDIPYNPHRSVWYSAGAPLVGGDEGTTLVASHISKGRTQGAMYELHALAGGETVWTKDAAGDVQQWEVVHLWHDGHLNFPQEYFAADGTRQLVLTTCGGKRNSNGYYRENIFAVAVPVGDPIPAAELAAL